MLKSLINKSAVWLSAEKHIAPLAVLRMAFGAIMLISTIRFIEKGWIHDFYIAPKLYFPFYGFEWVKPLPPLMMYAVFALMAITSFFILTGLFYPISITTFFICFVYVELIDKTYYLNHYYFVSLISFLLMLVPAHRYFSIDVMRRPSLKVTRVPAWTINIFKFQLCLIYCCAGLSKLNYDWMGTAMPLKIWLPANADMPFIGGLLKQGWVAYLFSWFGAVFDLLICFFLLYKPTRPAAYIIVIIFHVFTGWLFKIGMFPYIMIAITIIFFSEDFHTRLIAKLYQLFVKKPFNQPDIPRSLVLSFNKKNILYTLLTVYICVQLFLPFRFIFYPGKLLWTEEGYRFSWRVMLMEKGGTTFFYATDPNTEKKYEVINAQFLTPLQEKMMETQPDMILQYAHHLKNIYAKKGTRDPVITVQSYVTLNGKGSRLFIDSNIDLSKQPENFFHKKWILPLQ